MNTSSIKYAEGTPHVCGATVAGVGVTPNPAEKSASASRKPKVCLGMPLYNQTQFLLQALNSILSQTYRDFKLIVVDDSTDPAPGQIVKSFAAEDQRIIYFKNEHRKALIGNKNECFRLAGKVDYFAWVADHDVWHPDWLESMVRVLETNPNAVVVYPQSVQIDLEGQRYPKKSSFKFSTEGLSENERIKAVCRNARGYGMMIYGLFRAEALLRAGILRRVLFPDVILMHELSLQGDFLQVEAELFYRRRTAAFSIARQKQTLFTQKPWYIFLPWPFVNAAVLAWNTAFQLHAGKLASRYRGMKVSGMYLLRYIGWLGEESWIGSYREWRRGRKPWMKRFKKRFKKQT